MHRQRLGDEYNRQSMSVLGQWESDIQKSKETEEKLQNMFKQQQKLFQQQRVVQAQRLKTIKQLQEQYMKVRQTMFNTFCTLVMNKSTFLTYAHTPTSTCLHVLSCSGSNSNNLAHNNNVHVVQIVDVYITWHIQLNISFLFVVRACPSWTHVTISSRPACRQS